MVWLGFCRMCLAWSRFNSFGASGAAAKHPTRQLPRSKPRPKRPAKRRPKGPLPKARLPQLHVQHVPLRVRQPLAVRRIQRGLQPVEVPHKRHVQRRHQLLPGLAGAAGGRAGRRAGGRALVWGGLGDGCEARTEFLKLL